VTAGSALVLFALLLPQVGLSLPNVTAFGGLDPPRSRSFFVIYIRVDLPQFVHRR